jgi:hypothetical protein
MSRLIKDHQWVYVVVQDPEKDARYLGQHETESDTAFIPVFIEKEHALMCMNLLVKDRGKKYEVQAVMVEELAEHAAAGGFKLYVLNSEGSVEAKISPFD